MKRLIISSLLIIAITGLVVGLGTFAYFSDSASSTDNTFGSGTIDLKVRNVGDPWSDSESATWSSPANWAPGDTVDAFIEAKNDGTIDVNALLSKISLTGSLAGCTPNIDCGLADKIDMIEYNDDTSVGSGAFFVDYFKDVYDVDDDDHLTMAEWSAGHSSDPSRAAYDTAWYCDGSGPAPGNLPCLLANGVETGKGTPPNPYFFIHIKWQFNPEAGNDYQGLTATYTLKMNAQQTWAPGSPGWPGEDV